MRTLALPLLAILLLPLSACDEVGPLSIDGGVDMAVDDAVIARDQGNYDAAVTLLERALVEEPANSKVRVELATTLLQRDGIDLLDLDRIGQFLTETATGSGAGRTAARGGCAFASDPTATVFDPTEVEGFDELLAGTETLDRAEGLLDGVVPQAVTSFQLCTSVADGELVYDRAGAIADLGAKGLTAPQQSQTLAVSALTDFVDAYLYVSESLPESTTWYRLADGSIAICADDEAELREAAEAPIQAFGQAVLALDARAEMLGGSSVATEVVEVALDAYQELQQAVVGYCTTG
ncbi:tetratricopeptide repeat protein [Rubrivirga sp. IMCC43871]|uniref:tetratricopeptide repeat protein n=1 Tax=Rubrivirga sp. IMCC43871 TaxID=3391575 RepID=UPI0039902BCF